MIASKETHIHNYTKLGMIRITKITNKRYRGSAGDKAFLVRSCECKKHLAFEYGSYEDMVNLFQTLKSVEKSNE